MKSINSIIHSKEFQREAPEPLKNLIRRRQRETFSSEASAFSLMLPTDRTDRADRQTNQNTNGEQKEKRRGNGVQIKKLNQN